MDNEIQQCTNAFVLWLISGAAEFRLEQLYWLGGAVLAGIAVLALRTQAKYARASFLLEIGKRWDDLGEAREWVSKTIDQVTAEISSTYPEDDETKKRKRIRENFTAKLHKLHKEKGTDYRNVSKVSGFFETVGIMVHKRYVPLDDAIALLKGPIVIFEQHFADHIARRQKELHMPPGLYEHALSLAKKTNKRYVQRGK